MTRADSFGVGQAPKFRQLQNYPAAPLCGVKSGDPQFCRPIAYPPKRGHSRVNVGRLARLVTVEVEAIMAGSEHRRHARILAEAFSKGAMTRRWRYFEYEQNLTKLFRPTCVESSSSKWQENQMAAKKSSGKKSGGRRYGKAAGKTVASAMRRKKRGTLRSGKGGKGGKVKSREQAIAIGLSEARKKGAKVPPKKSS